MPKKSQILNLLFLLSFFPSGGFENTVYIKPVTTFRHVLVALFCLLAAPLSAQTNPPSFPPASPPLPSNAESFKEVSPGVLQLGLVTVEPKQRLVKISAVVNMKDGTLNYALVGPAGKAGESLLVTKALPAHLHQAMILLGFQDSSPTPATIPSLDVSPALLPLHITLHWMANGKPEEAALENWLLNGKTQEPMAAGDWFYNGLRTSSDSATGEPAFIALLSDPLALIGNSRQNQDAQAFWKAKTDAIPEVGTLVEIHIQLGDLQVASLPPSPSEPFTSERPRYSRHPSSAMGRHLSP